MNLSGEIKEFLERGGRCLIIEDGEPRFVISTFREYAELLRNGSRNQNRRDLVAEINRDIGELAQGDGGVENGHAHHPPHDRFSPPKGVFYTE